MAEVNEARSTSFLPDLCGIRALFGVVVIGELLAVVLSLAGSGSFATRLERLSLISLFTQWAALSAAAVLCLTRQKFDGFGEKPVAVLSYGLILVVVYLASELAWWLAGPASPAIPITTIARGDFLLRTMGVSVIAAALVLRYFYVQHHWKLRTVSEADARLEALQARIRPHFLFNCMNTIASLTRTDPRAAERAVEDLADLFRASIGDARRLVSIEEELDLVRRYLDIEMFRLGARLATTWDIKPLPSSARIPLLTLQPLVENAINHGIEPLPQGGVIGIAARCSDNRVEISCVNPVSDITRPHRTGHQLGQENVRQRLAAHFGIQGQLRIDDDEHQYRVTINVPAHYDHAYSDR